MYEIEQDMNASYSVHNMEHRRELSGNCPVFTVGILIYYYVDRIGEFLLPPIFVLHIRL